MLITSQFLERNNADQTQLFKIVTSHETYVNFYESEGTKNEPVHELSNNVVCATSKASDQPAHTRSLIRAFASHFSIL